MGINTSIHDFLADLVPNYIRKEKESRYYSEYIFKADYYISHGSNTYPDDKVAYRRVRDCHVFSMGTQDTMIADGWLRESFTDEYRDESILDDWLEENMTGFYATRGWGNGRANRGQSYYGLWHVEVYIIRDIDAMAFRLRWGG